MERPGHNLNISVLTGVLLLSLSLFLLALVYEETNGFKAMHLIRDEEVILISGFIFSLLSAFGFLFRIKATRYIFILPFIGVFCILLFSFLNSIKNGYSHTPFNELVIISLGFIFLLSFIVYLILIGTHRDILKSFRGNDEENFYDTDILDSE